MDSPLISKPTSPQHAPIVIVGQGAIALLAASQCALAGYPCYLQGRAAASQTAMPLDFRRGQQNFPLLLSLRPAHVSKVAVLLVCVKAYDAVAACRQWLPLLADDGCLVLCHNGMGTADAVTAMLGKSQQLWLASTTHGALKTGPHRLVHTGLGGTSMGPANLAAKQAFATPAATLIDAMQAALAPITLTPNIAELLWQKLLVNLVINPLTALHQCRNGELLAAEFQPRVAALINEAVQVAQVQGIAIDQVQASALVRQVMQRTAENYSSMQQDVAMHRRTELAAITGFLLKCAATQQLAVPTHQQLYDELTARLEPWQYQ